MSLVGEIGLNLAHTIKYEVHKYTLSPFKGHVIGILK